MKQAQGTGHSIVEQMVKKSRVTDRIGIRVPHFLALPLIVASSDMIATIPRPLGVCFENIAPIRSHKHPLNLPAIDINIFWHERFNHDGANVWLRGVFRQVRDAIAWDRTRRLGRIGLALRQHFSA